ncbi:MAG: class I SAM-dependent methyltransferase [Phycisphaerales bacterium]
MTRTAARPGAITPTRAIREPLLARSARRAVLRVLAGLRIGRLTIDERGVQRRFAGAIAGPEVVIRIHDPRAYSAMLFGGSIGAGESYTDGWWDTDDVTGLIQLMLRNYDALEQLDRRGLTSLLAPVRRLLYRAQRNTRDGSRRNIAAHYDLSNEFFALWLDPTMSYSCAIFEPGSTDLEAAQVAKIDRACRVLELRPTDHLLEIGTGWGAMAMHAAREYGCRVTTTTISRRQAEEARRRISEADLDDRITVLERDYRDLDGVYDKLVSIEMIEAVGAERFDDYFAQCSRLLAPHGKMLLQAITIRDRQFARAAKTRDWLKKHIFPGSCLTSVSAIMESVRRSTDMVCADLHDIGPDYATTLRQWRERFDAREDDVRALGFDDRFVRMWRYYFCYCEGAFLERHTSDVQMLLAKPRAHLAPDRAAGS